jgi:hypothetical protein
LVLIDSHLPFEDFFRNAEGLEMFITVFKLTFYNNDYSVVNDESGGYL